LPENIPDDLKAIPRWVGWCYIEEIDSETGEVDWDKPPLNGHTGGRASSTNPATWCPFEVALEAYKRDRLDGVGFVLHLDENHNLVGIDLDKCRDAETGKIHEWAWKIIKLLNSYTEVSPSGRGVRIILRGKLPPTGRKKGSYENYETGRYVTMTGHHIEGTPTTIEARQAELEEVHRQVFGSSDSHAGNGAPRRPRTSLDLDDAEIIRRASEAHNSSPKFKRLWSGDTTGYNSHSEADLALCNLLAFWCGPDAARIDELFQQSGLFRSKWKRSDYRDRTIHKALEGRTDYYTPPNGCGKTKKESPHAERDGHGDAWEGPDAAAEGEAGGEESPPRSRIVITPDEHLVTDKAVAALARDSTIYQRPGIGLVHVVRESKQLKGIERPKGSPRIVPVPLPRLRERLAANALFLGHGTRKGQELKHKHPPAFCVQAVAARGEWEGIRELTAVVNSPVLRRDGTVLDRPGYDALTGLIYETNCPPVPVPRKPTAATVRGAFDLLAEVVADFPFAQAAHKSAWVAGLLTPLARFAFSGPAPLFLVDSNVRGSGKNLLCDVTALTLTGREMPRMANSENDEECRKRITALAVGGDLSVLIDNIAGHLGCPALDSALTSTTWKDRILGRTEIAEMPLQAVWYATGNNVAILADTSRRVAHIRLESKLENPEERKDLRHPQLKEWVLQERPRLLAAALTILRGYCAAGRPDQRLTPWGSYEGWSALVRSAVVWAGFRDPGETRQELRKQSDKEAGALQAILVGLEFLDRSGAGLTASQIVEAAADRNHTEEELVALREAILTLCPLGKRDFPSARSVGMKLHHLRGRVAGGKFLERNEKNHAAVWSVGKCEGEQGRGLEGTTGTNLHTPRERY
jgi:hypothetical protein